MFKKILLCFGIGAFVLFMNDFINYPESYLTTWKYQLKTDLTNGKPSAVEYYTEQYYKNGRDLFNDNFAILKEV